MTRRFPIDPDEAEQAAERLEQEASRRTRKRPADKRWKRPVSDKSPRPDIGASSPGDSPDGIPQRSV
jgi:hypothetical protein